MAMAEEEMRKELAASDESQRPNDGNIFLYLLQRMDNVETNLREEIKAHRGENEIKFNKLEAKIDSVETNLREELKAHREETEIRFNKLDAKIDSKIDGVEQKLDSTIRWIVGTIVSVAGIAVAVLVWLVG